MKPCFALVLPAALCAMPGLALADAADRLAAAKAEGVLNVIGLPHDWCNYGALIDGFKAKYGISVNETDPDAGSAAQVTALRATGLDGPDVVDLLPEDAVAAAGDGLLYPYKPEGWDKIPEAAKDSEGRWHAGYFSVVSFEFDADYIRLEPRRFEDLLTTKFLNDVAIPGDPRFDADAAALVQAAGFARARGDRNRMVHESMMYMIDLNTYGDYIQLPPPMTASGDTMIPGYTPLILRWDYDAIADQRRLQGLVPVKITLPDDPLLARYYVTGIAAKAPHPAAAKLWTDYFYSDEAQLAMLRGACHPIRYAEMMLAGKVPPALLDGMPDPYGYLRAVFLPPEAFAEAAKYIRAEWDASIRQATHATGKSTAQP